MTKKPEIPRVICGGCGIAYPPSLVEPAVLELVDPDTGDVVGPHVVTVTCGICALVLANAVSGEDRTSFAGPKAEALRQGALAWRRQHGYADA
jgi:hypothetical protein